MSKEGTVERPALGQNFSIGQFYNIHEDKPLNDRIFNKSEDEIKDKIVTGKIPKTDYAVKVTNSWEDKMELLNIEGSVSLSIMAGQIKVDGSAKYLNDVKSKRTEQSMTCIVYIQTEEDTIFLRENKELIDLDVFEDGKMPKGATHVVTRIKYGANGTVSAKYSLDDQQDKTEVNGNLKAEFNKAGMAIKGEVDVKSNEELSKKFENFEFRWQCDVNDGNQGIPITFEGAVKKMMEIPQILGDKRGVPIDITLTPLKDIAKMCEKKILANTAYNAIEKDALKKVMVHFQRLDDNLLDYRDLVHELEEDKDFVRSEKLLEATTALTDGETEKARLQKILKESLVKIRSGEGDTTQLDSWIENLNEGCLGGTKVEETRLKFEIDLYAVREIRKVMAEERIKVIGKSQGRVPDNLSGMDYVLKTRLCDDDEDVRQTSENYRRCFLKLYQFQQEMEKLDEKGMEGKIKTFYWQDLTISGKSEDVALIERYQGRTFDQGKGVYDSYQEQEKLKLIDMSSAKYWAKFSGEQVELKLDCPQVFSGKCSNFGGQDQLKWRCKECHEPIWFDHHEKTDEREEIKIVACLVCKKAYENPMDIPLRCAFVKHGFPFVKYDVAHDGSLNDQISELMKAIKSKRDPDHIYDEFKNYDKDGDLKLDWEEAKPMFIRFEERLKTLETVQKAASGDLTGAIQPLLDRLEGTDTEIEKLQETDTRLETRIGGYDTEIEKLQEADTRLETTIGGHDTRIGGHDTKIENLQETDTRLETRIGGHDTKIEKLQKKIVFAARKTSPGGDFDGEITYDIVDINEGAGFDQQSGKFRAPEGGTYFFAFSGVTGTSKSLTYVRVYKDGSEHHVIVDDNVAHTGNNINGSWMSSLSKGEEVHLDVTYGKLRAFSAVPVIFTGNLLKLDE